MNKFCQSENQNFERQKKLSTTRDRQKKLSTKKSKIWATKNGCCFLYRVNKKPQRWGKMREREQKTTVCMGCHFLYRVNKTHHFRVSIFIQTDRFPTHLSDFKLSAKVMIKKFWTVWILRFIRFFSNIWDLDWTPYTPYLYKSD